MAFNIGKVREYNGISGTIVTPEDSYMFLDSDIDDNINVGDLVKFRAEEIHGISRAFFVKLYSEKTLDKDADNNRKTDFVKQLDNGK